MTKRELLDDPNSCLNRSQDDEPVFLLCARDEIAPSAVRDWAERAEMRGVNSPKVTGAIQDAIQMEQWQKERGSKLPD
jgi:hypothetical protein